MPKKLLKALGYVVALIAIVGGSVIGIQAVRQLSPPSEPTAQDLASKVIEGFELAAGQLNDMTP